MKRGRIAITGVGAVTPVGEGMEALTAAMLAGASGLGRAAVFEGTPVAARVVGTIERGRKVGDRRGDAANAFATRAAAEALEDARMTLPNRVALIVGSTMAPRDRDVDAVIAELAVALGVGRAVTIVVETACTSGSAAIAVGAELVRGGVVDVAIAGGADELDAKTIAGFAALGLLAPEACTPFGARVGTTLAEGAAFVVLEDEGRARARGARVRAIVEGEGSRADAFHPTSPHPSGDGLAGAMRTALADAGVTPDEIDWVSAHGTGTRANDAAEIAALAALFGPRSSVVPVAATKSQIGHALGAAGAIELAVVLGALDAGRIPPTLGAESPRPGHALALSTTSRALPEPSASARPDVGGPLPSGRVSSAGRVLKCASAFGGANAALLVAHPAVAKAARPRLRRRVFVVGAGAFGGADALVDPMGVVDDFVAPAPTADVEPLVPGLNARGLCASSRALVVAVARALANADDRGEVSPPDRTGLYVGQRAASPSAVTAFEEALVARGYDHVPGGLFTRRVLNTATGAASRARDLRGPTLTLSTGRGSGLVAVALAAEHLASKDDADRIVVAAVDEGAGDGAAAIVLAAFDPDDPRIPRRDADSMHPRVLAELTGWTLFGPHAESDVDVDRASSVNTGAGAAAVHVSRVREDVVARASAGILAFGRALHGVGDRIVDERGDLASARIRFR